MNKIFVIPMVKIRKFQAFYKKEVGPEDNGFEFVFFTF